MLCSQLVSILSCSSYIIQEHDAYWVVTKEGRCCCAASNEVKRVLLTVLPLLNDLSYNTHTHTHDAISVSAATHTHAEWASYLMGASMILLSSLWWSSLATRRPVHSTATEVARHRMMPRQHSTLNTDKYRVWLKLQSYREGGGGQRGY